MQKKIKIFLIIIILCAATGGSFYWQWSKKPSEEPRETPQPPTLFGKEDYKIEERADGKYIVVEKVGLTCKVPEEWKIEQTKGYSYPEPGYWIDLYSPDAEVFDVLTKGCGISIMTGIAKETVEEIKENIKLIQQHPEKSNEIREDYNYEIIGINNYQGLKWISPEKPIFGQASGVDIPIGDKKLINLSTQFPPGYKEKCFPIWEEFLKTVVIK